MNRVDSNWDRFLRVTTLLILSLTVVLWVIKSAHANLDNVWTSIRLAPSFALKAGLPLYSSAQSPPWVTVGYGPFYPVAYLPATLASTPTSAVGIATVLAYGYLLVPILLLTRQMMRQDKVGFSMPTFLALQVTLIFALIATLIPSLRYVLTSVHVDAPALGLMLLSAYWTLEAIRESPSPRTRHAIAAGLTAALSLCCKLNLLPFVALLAIALAFWTGKRLVAAFSITFTITATLIYGWAIATCGLDTVILNMRVLALFPWLQLHVSESGALSTAQLSQDPVHKPMIFLFTLREYMITYGWTALVAGLLIRLPVSDQPPHARATLPRWWILLAALLLALTPASVASLCKYGGDVNSRALVSLPLALLALFTVLYTCARARWSSPWLLSLAAILVVGLTLPPPAASLFGSARSRTTSLEEAYGTVKHNPGIYYFPFDPLAHILAERQFRPNIDVIYSYAMGKNPVDKTAFASALPEDLRYLAISPQVLSWGQSEINRLLPEFSAPAKDPSLERHTVLQRSIPKPAP